MTREEAEHIFQLEKEKWDLVEKFKPRDQVIFTWMDLVNMARGRLLRVDSPIVNRGVE